MPVTLGGGPPTPAPGPSAPAAVLWQAFGARMRMMTLGDKMTLLAAIDTSQPLQALPPHLQAAFVDVAAAVRRAP